MRGELLAVITTDALELGIDIGALDAAVVVTFPGTVASLRQMWGRAGRRGRGLAVYVAGEDALDQFFCRHPDEFLERAVEAAILDHENEPIHLAHLLCAAHEGPLSAFDDVFLGPRWEAHAQALVAMGELVARDDTYVLRHPEDYPAARVSLRSASPDSFAVVDVSSGELLGTVESARAHTTVHDGAVYLHQARSYIVRALEIDTRRALVEPFSGDFYTQPKKETMTEIEALLDRRDTCGVQLSFGRVSVTEQVLAYQRKKISDHSIVDLQALDLPETTFQTQALWFELHDDLLADGLPAGGAARLAARRRARADRRPAAAGDVRPLGHRRPVDERPPADGRADDLHLRRPPRRRRHHAPGLWLLRDARRRRAPAHLRVRVQGRLPVVRAVAEVRQPQRAAREGGRARAAGADARALGERRSTSRPSQTTAAGVRSTARSSRGSRS